MKPCNCDSCISACKNDPGRLIPQDIPKIAEKLKITAEQCIKEFFVRVPTVVRNETVYALTPAKRKGKHFVSQPGTIAGKTAGKEYSNIPGICIFLEDNGDCSIHDVKPFECKAYMGCSHTFLGKPYREKTVEEYFFSRWRLFYFEDNDN